MGVKILSDTGRMIPVFIHFYLVSCTHGRNDPDSLCLEIPFDSDSSVFIHSNMKQHGGAHEIAKKRVKTSVSTCFQSEELLFIFNIKNSQTYSAFIFMLENSHTVSYLPTGPYEKLGMKSET